MKINQQEEHLLLLLLINYHLQVLIQLFTLVMAELNLLQELDSSLILYG